MLRMQLKQHSAFWTFGDRGRGSQLKPFALQDKAGYLGRIRTAGQAINSQLFRLLSIIYLSYAEKISPDSHLTRWSVKR